MGLPLGRQVGANEHLLDMSERGLHHVFVLDCTCEVAKGGRFLGQTRDRVLGTTSFSS